MGYTDFVAHDPSVGNAFSSFARKSLRRRHLPALPRREESGGAA
jgi:hypothetical protein